MAAFVEAVSPHSSQKRPFLPGTPTAPVTTAPPPPRKQPHTAVAAISKHLVDCASWSSRY